MLRTIFGSELAVLYGEPSIQRVAKAEAYGGRDILQERYVVFGVFLKHHLFFFLTRLFITNITNKLTFRFESDADAYYD